MASQQYTYNIPTSKNSSGNNTSPLNNLSYLTPPSSSTYSYHSPRLRYYLSKSFDIEDDLEFCPEIVDRSVHNSSGMKKFNPHTSASFSPSQEYAQHSGVSQENRSTSGSGTHSPRVSTPRIKKALEIVNPQTRMRVGSPANSQNR
ncbi:hypothetical protein KGF57_004642 [Candida theae]|uniref:Uncharacterized protein n=1 Tax=Candida theae TaxID=1198502 RepID=A0AAD5FWP8_9ASCO|nr:uncharacterized protein KGF57_004642 [Candida theae]KAI5949819.1 hypothetical protein KGF57_004642 [Candida theae]